MKEGKQHQPRNVMDLDDEQARFGEEDVGNYQTEDGAKVLAAKLGQLTLEERTKGIYDLHGVADIETETPEVLQSKLQRMSDVADSFGSNERTAAYRQALDMQNKEYVERIKLLCLRADYLDCEKAAERLVLYFSLKRQLFGTEKLTKEILHEDLEPEDQEVLEAGGICQLLQERDRAGRAIVLAVGKFYSATPFLSICRVQYYIFKAAVRDEEIQKKGIVFVYNLVGQKEFLPDRIPKLMDLWWAFPVKLVALHACHNTPALDVALNKYVLEAIKGHFLVRFRAHVGSDRECFFELMTFGIPQHVWPIDLDSGELDLKGHQQWVYSMKGREQAQLDRKKRPSSGNEYTSRQPVIGEVIVAGRMDIVMSRGRNSKSSAGYLRLKDLVEKYCATYDNAERIEKIAIAGIVLRDLQKLGCRFVRETPEGLVLQSDAAAIGKISHAFRNLRAKNVSRKGRETGTTKRNIS